MTLWWLFCTFSKFSENDFHCFENDFPLWGEKKRNISRRTAFAESKTWTWNSPFSILNIEKGVAQFARILILQSFDSLLLFVQDWERLHAASWDMQAYWNMLEWKRKQLENEEKEQVAVQTTIPSRIKHIQLDLRDLMSEVNNQVSAV